MENDTISLLGDCTAGIDMALSTIDGLMGDVKDHVLREKLQSGAKEHQLLRKQAVELLGRYGGQEKGANPMAKAMSWLKTNGKMTFGDDTTAADLVANGCDMGVRSLSKSRNKFSFAKEDAIDLAQELIRCEEALSADMRPYL